MTPHHDHTKKGTTMKFWLVAAGITCAGLALAQEANPYNGKWRVDVETRNGFKYQAALLVNDKAGTYQAVAHLRNDACAGREAPIAVKQATSDVLEFAVLKSQALAGCKDWTVTLKRKDDKTLEGRFPDGSQATVVRQ